MTAAAFRQHRPRLRLPACRILRDKCAALAYSGGMIRAAAYLYWFSYPHNPAEAGARLV